MTGFVGRLVPMQVGSPTRNMAVDQMLLESVDQGGRVTLRLYGWDQPTLSLGYFQSSQDRARHCESQDLPCVRRATGGGAIVHDHELTYSVALPVANIQAGARHELYQQLHLAITRALAAFGVSAVPHRLTAANDHRAVRGDQGVQSDRVMVDRPEPFLCFQRRTPEDLIVAGYKVLGSAQRRSRHAVLQHGSLLLQSSRWAPQLPGIRDLAPRSVSITQLSQQLVAVLAEVLELDRWEVEPLADHEQARAGKIESTRFADPQWLHRR